MTLGTPEPATCIACLGEARLAYKICGYGIHRCGRCCSFSVLPRPTAVELDAAYASGSPKEDETLELGDATVLDARDAKVAHLRSLGPQPGRLLDVGCGAGHLLAQARLLGWEPHGVDLSARHVATAREGYGLEHVRVGTVADLDYPRGYFDAVALTAVIEHLRDPQATLQAIGPLLARDGRLILQTDNARSLSYLLMRGRWPFFIPPFHLQNFTTDGLRKLLHRSGFVLERIQTIRDIQPVQLHTRTGLSMRLCRTLALAAAPAFAMLRATGHGELLAVTARAS